MTFYEDALAKSEQLDPKVQYAARRWITACFQQNFEFYVTETLRTKERQKQLYAQGRTKPGEIVTYDDGVKHVSLHQLGLAMDVYPVNCSYEDLERIAALYGITHPYSAEHARENNGFIDEPHFQFDQVPPERTPDRPASATLRRLEREANQEKDPATRLTLLRRLDRLKSRLPPAS